MVTAMVIAAATGVTDEEQGVGSGIVSTSSDVGAADVDDRCRVSAACSARREHVCTRRRAVDPVTSRALGIRPGGALLLRPDAVPVALFPDAAALARARPAVAA